MVLLKILLLTFPHFVQCWKNQIFRGFLVILVGKIVKGKITIKIIILEKLIKNI